jgi:L-phenylalanine/L-methionine N-acetyltransferase
MHRKITTADFEFIYGLYMHPQTNPYLLYEMMDAATFKPVFDELLVKEIVYVFEVSGVAAGMFKFITQQHRNAHTAYLGGVAIHPEYAGKGYGRQMLQEIIEMGRRQNLKRIELSVATFNDTAIHLYEKVGFVKEGVLRRYTWLVSEGQYIDEYMMSYLY